MQTRYLKNMNMLSEIEMGKIMDCKVCVVGCGGLGGYIIEMLGRLGVGNLTIVDGDVFDETNLNRQVLSTTDVIGKSKVEIAKSRMSLVNPDINIIPIFENLTMKNGEDILKGHNVIIDAVDNVHTRLLLQDLAADLEIPLVHGAISGWYGQITTVLPEDKTLSILYPENTSKGVENPLGNPSFTPALVASIQVSETLKLLIGRGELLRNRVLYIDLFEQEYEIVQMSG